MGFCLQLRMLLWKNFLLRKRQKFRLVVELMWPLFLFLILMWVRTRGLRINISECHFTPKALPSAGQLPFLQSFLCSFNNTCHITEHAAQIDGSNIRSSRLEQLLEDLSRMFGERLVGRDLEAAESVVENIDSLARLVQGVESRQVQVKGSTKVSELVNSTSWVKEEIFRTNISLSENTVDALINSELSPQKLTLVISTLKPCKSELFGEKDCSEFKKLDLCREKEAEKITFLAVADQKKSIKARVLYIEIDTADESWDKGNA